MKNAFKVIVKVLLVASFISCTALQAQIPLSFTGTPVVSGSAAGTVGARYTYENVGTTGGVTIRAVVEIVAIDGAGLDNIDGPVSAGGTDAALQPVIYGTQTSGNCWSIRFRISFYNSTTNDPIRLSSFRASGIDIDGNGSSLREHNTFFFPATYTVQNPTNLTTVVNAGVYRFQAPSTSYTGISLTQTNVAVTCIYNNNASIDISLGACCAGGACNVPAGTGRQHSINFFDAVAFSSPVVTLPVEIVNFSASLSSSGTLLKWTTSDEVNLSHFVIQKSQDGVQFTDMGRVNAAGSGQYSFTDQQPVGAISYYRLKAVDIDGKEKYSSVVSITSNARPDGFVFISQRGSGQSDLIVQLESAQDLDIHVYSAAGALLDKIHKRLQPGSHVIPLNIKQSAGNGVMLVNVQSSKGWAKTVKNLVR